MSTQHPQTSSGLTRRRFFEQLGAIGGSSLVFTAMQSLDLFAQESATRPQLTGRPAKRKVIVLGAGISGLVTCYELGKLGYDAQILEARERVGGLSWTVRKGTEHTELGPTGEHQVCTFDEGLYVNCGPWRVPYSHTGVLGYCRELGVQMQIFVNEADQNYFFYENNPAAKLSNKRIRMRDVKADMAGHVNELLLKAIDQKGLDTQLSKEDQDRFINYLVNQGFVDPNDHHYKASVNRGPGEPIDFQSLVASGFTNRFRSVPPVEGTAAAPMFQPVGGMDMIPKAFQRVLGTKITLGAEVTSVHQDANGVAVTWKNTKSGKVTVSQADYVVACLPMTVLAGMDINLTPERMAAIKAVPHSDSAKMGLAMKRRFWEEDDDIYGGHLYSNLPLGEFSYPSNDYFTKKGVLLGLYINGPVAGLTDKTVKERLDHVLLHATKVHPQIKDEFESAYGVFWRKVKYSQGGYATGAATSRGKVIAGVDNRIVVASAATAPHSEPSWQEGAVAAAWQGLTALHERAMRG